MTDFGEPSMFGQALPAETEGPIGQGRFGFVANPTPSHLERSAAAFQDLAAQLSSRKHPGTSWKQVWLGHVINSGFLSLSLYLFPFNEFRSSTDLVNIGDPEVPLRLAVVANMPVALQMQVVLSTLGDYVARQEYVAAVERPAGASANAIDDIDVRVEQLDRLVQETLIDDLRLGWEASARHIAQRAADIGLTFDVHYKAPLAAESEVLGRCKIARQTYNRIDLVRTAIDRSVSMVASLDIELRGGNIPETIRNSIQQSTAASQLSRYLAHLIRDSLVCGNGYLQIPEFEPFGFYCLPPDDTVPLSGNRYRVARSQVVAGDRVIHFEGMKQVGSDLGLSVLEPILIEFHKRQVFDSIEAALGPRIDQLNSDQRRWLEARRQQRQRIVQQSDERLRRLFPVPLADTTPEAQADLYLPGYERYRDSD